MPHTIAQLLCFHWQESIVWIHLGLLVYEVNTTLEKQIEEITLFLVETMCQIQGQCQSWCLPVTDSLIDFFLVLPWWPRPLFMLGISQRHPSWNSVALARRGKTERTCIWVCVRHFFVAINFTSLLLDIRFRRVEGRVKAIYWMAYKKNYHKKEINLFGNPPFQEKPGGFQITWMETWFPISWSANPAWPYWICWDANRRAETEERAIINSMRHGIET